MELARPEIWLTVPQIILIGILLGGDNAVVIAVACRNLPDRQRERAIFWGMLGAIGLRTALTLFVIALLAVPYFKLSAAILLFWIAIKLIVPDTDEGVHARSSRTSPWLAVNTILIANIVMSVDNVIAVAGAARDDVSLIMFGLLVSIPIIAWCTRLVLMLMERFPVVITLGGALLGYVAGDMMTRDPALVDWIGVHAPWLENGHLAGLVGALFVVGVALSVGGSARATEHGRIEVISKDEPSAG